MNTIMCAVMVLDRLAIAVLRGAILFLATLPISGGLCLVAPAGTKRLLHVMDRLSGSLTVCELDVCKSVNSGG
jgi:hypothetical protein